MDADNNNVDLTPRRKLDFSSDENQENEDVSDSDNVEISIMERHSSISEEKIPQIGMEFDTEKEAYNFYNEYAKLAGFSIRRHHIHKDISGTILDRSFCCSRQGRRPKDKRDVSVKSHRAESRSGCKAIMMINVRYTGKYQIVKFIADHKGHHLASPNKSHMLRSQRKKRAVEASQANLIDSSGIAPRAGFALMAKQVGGRENLGFIYEDYKNYLYSKRTVDMKIGDTGGVPEYLQKRQYDDSNFFYNILI